MTLDRNVPLAFEWDRWRRKDWDGQRLLELFHEFGFRGVRRPGPQDADDQRREEERRGAGDGGIAARPRSRCPSGEAEGQVRPAGKIGARLSRDRQARKSATRACSTRSTRRTPRCRSSGAGPSSRTDTWSYAGYELVDTPERFDAFLADLQKQKRFVFDLETTGLDPIGDAEIVGYAFCWEPGGRITFPFADRKGTRSSIPTRPCGALKPIFEDPGDREGQPEHQVRPDGAARRTASRWRASPAIR